MVRRVMTVVSGWPFALAALGLIGYVVYLQSVPASYWFEVRSVFVYDAVEGEPITMKVDRIVHREFFGEGTVIVRVITPDGNTQVCGGLGRTPYKVNSKLPDPLPLKWWSYDGCETLQAGQYQMTTTWRWELWFFGLSFLKEINFDSPPFKVLAKGEDVRSWAKDASEGST